MGIKSILPPHLAAFSELHTLSYGFPDSSVGKKIRLQCRRPRFDSWVGKICWRRDRLPTPVFLGFPYGSAGKESTCNAGGLGSIPGMGRSPEEGKSYPLQYSGLENSMDCIVHGVQRVRHDWATFTSLHFIHYLLLEQKQSSGGELVTQSCPALAAPWL